MWILEPIGRKRSCCSSLALSTPSDPTLWKSPVLSAERWVITWRRTLLAAKINCQACEWSLHHPAPVKTSEMTPKTEGEGGNYPGSPTLYPPVSLSASVGASMLSPLPPFGLTKWSQLTGDTQETQSAKWNRTGETRPGSVCRWIKGKQVWRVEKSRGCSLVAAMEKEEELVKKQRWAS